MTSTPDDREWKPIAGFPGYEASHRGFVRSIDRKVGNRNLKGRELKQRPSNQGYQQVDMTDEHGKQQTRPVHWCVLTAHAGRRPEGMEALHERDNQLDNRYPESLSWGPPWKNREQRAQNSPPAPKPQKECVRCEKPFEGNGRRCHPCVKAIGKESAKLLRSGVPLDEELAKRLDYPSVEGIHKLAVRYGGYGKPLLSRYVTGPLATLGKRLPVQRRVTSQKNRNPAPKAPQKRARVPVSPGTNLGQTGHTRSHFVAERDGREVARNAPKVTDSNQHPYPADSVWNRPERTRGGTSRRSRGAR